MRTEWIVKIFIGLLVGVLLFLLTILIHHEYKYVCIEGHDEEQMQFDPNLKMMIMQTVWVCDKEMLREDYNKIKNKKECNCDK